MTSPAPDAQVRLDIHPTHASAVIATVAGPDTAGVVAVLEADAWHIVAEATLVLVRIDREEPHWARKTADRLTADGVTVAITPRLQDAIDEEWTWAAYPMHWCTREEIREVSDQAQQIHDAIRHGRPTSAGSTVTPYAPGPLPSPAPSARLIRPAVLCQPSPRPPPPDR